MSCFQVPPPPPPRMDSVVSSVTDSHHSNGPVADKPKSTVSTATGPESESPIIDENAEWAKVCSTNNYVNREKCMRV